MSWQQNLTARPSRRPGQWVCAKPSEFVSEMRQPKSGHIPVTGTNFYYDARSANQAVIRGNLQALLCIAAKR